MSCKGWTESNSGHSVIDTCFFYTILGMKGQKQGMKLQSDIGHFPKIFGACPNKKIMMLRGVGKYFDLGGPTRVRRWPRRCVRVSGGEPGGAWIETRGGPGPRGPPRFLRP